MSTKAVPGAHRLELSAVEIDVLAEACGVTLPPGFRPGDEAAPAGSPADAVDDPAARQAARTALTERGVLSADPGGRPGGVPVVPVAPVAANLAVLAAGTATVRFDVTVGSRAARTYLAVQGELGASLAAAGVGAVELSMFPALLLGRELVRAVPPAGQLVDARSRIGAALDTSQSATGSAAAARPTGRLPLEALAEFDLVRRLTGGSPTDAAMRLGLTSAETDLVARLTQRTTGVLRCMIMTRTDGSDDAAVPPVAVAQFVWLATDGGWLGVRPDPDGTGRRMVRIDPVEPVDAAGWAAPYLATILDSRENED